MVITKTSTKQRCPRMMRQRTRIASVRLAAVSAATVLVVGVTAPAAVGDWVELGPDGGTIQALVMAPSDPSTVYAGTSGNGVFRSVDGGATWTVAHDGMGRTTVTALAVDPRDAGHVFASTPDGRIFESEDGAAGWRPVVSTGVWVPSGKLVHALILDDAEAPMLWVAAGATVYRSADLGRTWSATVPGTPTSEWDAVFELALNPRRPGEVWAGTSWGLFSSMDSGSTWTEHRYNGHALASPVAIAIDPTDPDTVYASTGCNWCGASAFSVYYLMRSTDDGLSWAPLYFPGIATGQPVTLAIDPGEPQHLVAAGQQGVATSLDGGATWASWSIFDRTVYAAVIDAAESDRILAATSGGVLISSDGGVHWETSNNGLRAASLGDIAVVGGSHPRVLAAGGDVGIMAFDPSSGAWASSGQGLLGLDMYPRWSWVTSIIVDPSSPLTVYAGGVYNGVFKSVDGGQHWMPARSGMEQGSRSPGDYYGPQALAIDPRFPSTLYSVTSTGIFKTIDAGTTWSESSTGMPTSPGLWAIAVDPVDPSIVICGGYKSYRSSDGGEHWEENPGPSQTAWVRHLLADPHGGGRFYATTRAGPSAVFRSDDSGLTWTQLPVPAEVGCYTFEGGGDPVCPYVSTVAVDPAVADSVYIGTPNGVWRSTDAGLTWSPVGTGTAGLLIYSMAFDSPMHTLYAASSGGGLLALKIVRARAHLPRAAPPLAASKLVAPSSP
jgi:photosystem II stability/assembly factor-like uncharacterized protein